LAWADGAFANETGVVALDGDGAVLDAGWTTGVEQTIRWASEHASETTLMFVDAPLLVMNATGQRLCETQVGQRYGAWKVSANSTNLSSPRLAGVRLREELEDAGWSYADGTDGPPRSGRAMSECYPYTATVGALELGYDTERPLYKRKPKRLPVSVWRQERAANCRVLIERIASLRAAVPPLDLASHPETARLTSEPSPIDDRSYKHREDLIDACLAAWSGLLWAYAGEERCQILGADDSLTDDRGRRATIIAPARLTQRRFNDTNDGEAAPRKIPRGGYLEVPMPKQFELQIRDHNRGNWATWAALRADWFGRNADGTYVCAAHGGSPIYIRALSIDPNGIIEHVDGDGYGDVHGYRLTPYDAEQLTTGYE
jgi:predicted RNase H-like nuclease